MVGIAAQTPPCPRCHAPLRDTGQTHSLADRYECSRRCGYSGNGSAPRLGQRPDIADDGHEGNPNDHAMQYTATIYCQPLTYTARPTAQPLRFQFAAAPTQARASRRIRLLGVWIEADDLLPTGTARKYAVFGGPNVRQQLMQAMMQAIAATLDVPPQDIIDLERMVRRCLPTTPRLTRSVARRQP